MKFEIEELPRNSCVAEKCHEEAGGYTTDGLIKVSPSECILPHTYQFYLEKIRKFEVQENDVFLISNPKCGTTWSQEMVWMIANDLDFEGAKRALDERFPYLEIEACLKSDMEIGSIEKISKMPSPRYIKSHLPKDLLPTGIWEKKTKIVFIVRDSRDAAISNFHHYKMFHGYNGTLEEFLENTLNDRVIYSPFWEHAIEFWKMKDEPNVLFLTYEEMKKDLGAVLHKTAAFFGKTLSDEDVARLKQHLSLETMRANRAVNFEILKERLSREQGIVFKEGNFMREGKSGGWRNVLSPEMNAKFEEWTSRKIAGTGLEALYG